jgi:hypothetical protein
VGKIIPRGEFHDGQTMVNHFNFVARRMADNKLMLNSMNLQDLQVMEEHILTTLLPKLLVEMNSTLGVKVTPNA